MLRHMSFINSQEVRAKQYHRSLPAEIRRYLNGRGITNSILDKHLVGWSGSRITIPIPNAAGDVIAFRYGKSPNDASRSPKMLSEVGASPQLYGLDALTQNPHTVVICEGEYDRLVLESRGIAAVTSTAGARAFLPEWAPSFGNVRRVFVRFDRDEAGELGAKIVKSILPQAIIVKLPAEVGPGGDITDFFVRLGKTRVDFEIMLANAAAVEEPEEAKMPPRRPLSIKGPSKAFRRRLDAVRKHVALPALLSDYMDLQASGGRLVGLCPFHAEGTPSFTVYLATNTYYCFGCGANGDALTFLLQKESMNLREALESLERFRDTNELFGAS